MITNLLTSVNKELEELNHQLKDNDYLYDLEERIKIINESINKTHQENKELNKEIERLNNIIKEAIELINEYKKIIEVGSNKGADYVYINSPYIKLQEIEQILGSDKVE